LSAPSIGPCGAADLGFLGLAALGILLDIALAKPLVRQPLLDRNERDGVKGQHLVSNN